ncbi:MAG TPA: ABC transporter substrate-binding protein [Dermatophilaceae bacterium]|nr:ABC transporter substrate-binding protein [Dermatophilaceae bacterium]
MGAALSLGFVAACGAPSTAGDRAGAAAKAAKVEDASASLDPEAQGPAPAVPGARKGGILTVSYSTVPDNLDPSDQFYQDTSVILNLTHRALTTFTLRDGKMILVPDLATDLGKVSEDGLSWTFTLKDGVKYEDGSPVTAQDVAFAIRRSFDKDLAAHGPTYQREFFKDGMSYAGPYTGDKNWQGVETPDAKTVVINLERRFETLPYFVSFSQFSPIPEGKDKKQDYQLHPLATGPYMFDRYTPGSELVLKRNPNWDPATDPARNAYPDGFHFKWGVEPVKTQTAILASHGDDATTLNWDQIDSSLLDQIQDAKRDQFVEGPSPCVGAVNLDTRKIPMEVRKAIAAAYPLDSIRKAKGMTTHSYAPAKTLIPPQVPGWLDYEIEGMTGKGDGNPEKARQLLKDAGKEGFELVYYYADDNPIEQRANQVRKQKLEKAGFRVTDLGVPSKELRSLSGDPKGKHNMLQAPRGWCFDWPSADSIFPPTVSSSALSQGSTGWGNLSEPKVDAEIKRISEFAIDDQGSEWGKFDKWLQENYLVVIPDYYQKGNYVFGTRVENVVNNPNRGMPELTQIWIEQ